MSRKLKILAIPPSSYIFGAERVTLDVFGGLKDKGHAIFCITNGWNDGSFHQELDKLYIPYTAVKLGWIYVTKPLWTIDSLWHLPKALIKAWKIIKKGDFDIIYTTSYRLLFLLYPILRNTTIVYHVHDVNSSFKKNRFFIKKVDSIVNCYIAVSEFIREDLIKTGISASKIKVVHNGIRIISANSLEEKKKPTGINFGIVGQIIPRKGHHFAIDAVGILKKQAYNTNLIIRGKGDVTYKEQLQQQIINSDLEHQVNWQPPKDIFHEIYEGIDVLLVTSEVEPFALVPIEGNLLCKPIIAPRHSGFLEFIQEGKNGLFFEGGNSEDLASKMKFFIDHPEEIKRMGAKGREIVLENFTLKHMIAKVEEVFLSL